MAPETHLVLARHGEVAGITPPRFRGRQDLPLTERGIRQAERTRDHLSCIVRPAAVYTSPLSRCVRTGSIIAQPWGLTVSPLPGFIDIDYGSWQGKSHDDVQVDDPAGFEGWRRHPHLAVIPGGESLYAATARVAGVLRTILAGHPGDTVVLVGHESVNRILLLLVLDLPLSRYWHLRQDPCAVSIMLHGQDDGWTVRTMNETAHLAGMG